jgi:hypothetical protein
MAIARRLRPQRRPWPWKGSLIGLLLLPQLAGCSGTTLGEALSRSFPDPGGPGNGAPTSEPSLSNHRDRHGSDPDQRGPSHSDPDRWLHSPATGWRRQRQSSRRQRRNARYHHQASQRHPSHHRRPVPGPFRSPERCHLYGRRTRTAPGSTGRYRRQHRPIPRHDPAAPGRPLRTGRGGDRGPAQRRCAIRGRNHRAGWSRIRRRPRPIQHCRPPGATRPAPALKGAPGARAHSSAAAPGHRPRPSPASSARLGPPAPIPCPPLPSASSASGRPAR